MQPQKINLLIHCRWLIPVIPENQIMENYSIAIHEGRIVDLLPELKAQECFTATKEIKLNRHIVVPGLINTHCQSSMRLLRGRQGAISTELEQEKSSQAQNSLIVDSEFVRDSNLLAMAEMIKTGTTCFADMCFPQESLIETVRNTGLRCQISFMVCDSPTAFAQSAEDHMHRGLNLYDKIGEHPLLKVACAPHDVFNMSDSAMQQISTYVNELDLSLHIPCHKTTYEINQSKSKHGCRPLARLNNLGLLSPQTRLVHMNHTNADDMQLLKQSNVHVVQCPTSSLRASEQLFPAYELQQADINTALGTGEICTGNSLNLLSEVRAWALMATTDDTNCQLNNVYRALQAATINGAKALGWEHEIGSLEAGKCADIIALEIDPILQQPLYNPQMQMIYSESGIEVSHSWVAGQPMMLEKQLVSLNENKLSQLANDWHDKLVK